MTTIRVPKNLGDKDLSDFFVRWNWLPANKGKATIDMTESSFLAPWAVTLFGIYSLWLMEQQGCTLDVRVDPTTRSGSYVIQSGLFDLLGLVTPSGFTIIDDSRTATLHRVEQSSDIPVFAESVMELLKVEDIELEGAVKYSLIELLRNIVQHSRSPIGGVAMAQYFPTTGIVEIAVADMGVGVRETLIPRYPTLRDDLAALKFALMPHVSGTFAKSAYGSMRDNAGLGLFFIKEIATRGNGGFFLGSGNRLVNLWGHEDGSDGKRYQIATMGGWNGTFAVLQLRRDGIGDFDSLLAVCRELAAEARRDPTESSLDFIDAIPDLPGLQVVRIKEFEENVDRAAEVRESVIIPAIEKEQLVILDFSGISFATQSFVHACMYRVLRDFPSSAYTLSLNGASKATKEAIRSVAAYARSRKEFN
jgi:hypothetical protein